MVCIRMEFDWIRRELVRTGRRRSNGLPLVSPRTRDFIVRIRPNCDKLSRVSSVREKGPLVVPSPRYGEYHCRSLGVGCRQYDSFARTDHSRFLLILR